MIKARNSITWSNQYVAHRDVKRKRRDIDRDISFGLATKEELSEMEIYDFPYNAFEPAETYYIPVKYVFLEQDDSDFYISEEV